MFNDFSFRNHSFLGIGVLPGDSKYVVGLKNKLIVSTSLFLSKVASIIKPLKYLSDSIYIKSVKKDGIENVKAIETFKQLHAKDSKNNLNLIPILRCPISGGELVLGEKSSRLFSPNSKVYYPIINNIPILVKTEAIPFNNF